MEQLQTVTEEWAARMLPACVYLNDQKSATVAPFRELPIRHEAIENIEAQQLAIPRGETTTVDKILNLLLTKSVRRGTVGLILPHLQAIKGKIEVAVDNGQQISMVMPSLPFKDQSPFSTGAPIDHTDLGEHGVFAQFSRIITGVRSVYDPGMHITVLCDGSIYADLFADSDVEGANRYREACERLKNEYGLHDDVKLLDINEILAGEPHWEERNAQLREIVCNLYKSDQTCKERIDHLASRFIYHVKQVGYTYESARQYFDAHQAWPEEIHERLLSSAIGYCAIQLAMKSTDIVNLAFPSAIRGTVHPKAEAQLPLNLSNRHCSLLPYNGVPLLSRQDLKNGRSLFNAMRIKRLCDVMACDNVVAVHRENEQYPFYFECA